MAPDPEVVEALAATDLFGSLNRRALNRVASSARTVTHAPGKKVTTEGEEGIAFHLILDGTATVALPGGGQHPLGKGDYFGEISMIDGQPRSATVTVDTPMRSAAITAWDFRPMLDEEPAIAKVMLQVLCRRIRTSQAAKA
jgi:CRP-like cAMP-binding protein